MKELAKGRDQLHPVVYGNGRWVLHPRPGLAREGTKAERSLKAVLRAREGAADAPGDGDEGFAKEMWTREGRREDECCSLREWESGVACGKC